MMLALLACLAGAVVMGISATTRAGRQVVWTAAGGALLLALTVALTSAATRIRHDHLLQDGSCGYLPRPEQSPDWRLDIAAGRMLEATSAELATAPASWISGTPDTRPDALLRPGPRWLIATKRPVIDPSGTGLAVRMAEPGAGAVEVWDGLHGLLADPYSGGGSDGG